MCLADNTLELGDWNLPKLYIKIYILSFRVRQSTNCLLKALRSLATPVPIHL